MSDNSSFRGTRRTVLQTVGAFGTIGTVGSRIVSGQPTEKETPDSYDQHGTQGNSFSDPAYFRHISDLGSANRRINQYERSGNWELLLTHSLRKKISESNEDQINITVTTTGQRSKFSTNGPFERTLYGWTPAPGEIKRLSQFGEVIQIPDVASTKVGISNVAIDDLSKLADLPFVLEIGHDPEIQPANTSLTTTSSSQYHIDDLKTSSHSEFDTVSQSVTSDIRIGYFHMGYEYGDGGQTTPYTKNWAEKQGIDKNLAKSFMSDCSWKDGRPHGMMVADTTAYMLSRLIEGGSTHVPLKVDDYSQTVTASVWRDALDYALKNDIPVGVTSHETAENEPYCTSTLCEELDSYTSAGYAMTVATGNDSSSTEVCHPATSYHAISVGGYSDQCSGGYERDSNSNYAEIEYYNDTYDTPYCSWCHNDWGDYKFQPDVYSSYSFETDGDNISGTSVSSPVVASGTAVHAAAYGPTDYYDHIRKYHNMSNQAVCPSGASKKGGVLHAPDLE